MCIAPGRKPPQPKPPRQVKRPPSQLAAWRLTRQRAALGAFPTASVGPPVGVGVGVGVSSACLHGVLGTRVGQDACSTAPAGRSAFPTRTAHPSRRPGLGPPVLRGDAWPLPVSSLHGVFLPPPQPGRPQPLLVPPHPSVLSHTEPSSFPHQAPCWSRSHSRSRDEGYIVPSLTLPVIQDRVLIAQEEGDMSGGGRVT